MIQIGLEIHIDAPRNRVWEILADHERMPEWFPAREVVRRRAGEPDPNGIGTCRVLRISGLAIEEIITAFKPCEHLEYSVTEGAPFVDHTADVILVSESNVTRTLERALSGLKRKAETH